MPSPRAIGAWICLVLFTQACAPAVRWFPARGACVDARRFRQGRASRWRYAIEGREATRDEVERRVFTTAVERDRSVHYGVVSVAAPTLVFAGGPTMIGGLVAAPLNQRPLLLLIPLTGLASLVTGVVLALTHPSDPLPQAVRDFNARAEKAGLCGPREPPEKPPPDGETGSSPAPRQGLPTLPSEGWSP